MSKKSWLLTLCMGAMWGSSFFFIEILLKTIHPFMIVFLRASVALIGITAFIIYKKIPIPLNKELWFKLIILGIITNVLPFSLITSGQQTISAGLASILNACAAFFGVMLSLTFINSERFAFHRLIGVIIGISGIIITIGYENILSIEIDNRGQYLVILATLFYALAANWAKIKLNTVDPAISTFGMLSTSTVLLFILTIYTDTLSSIAISFEILVSIACISLIGTSIGFYLWFKVINAESASDSLLVAITVPVFAVMLDGLILNQFLNNQEIIGFIFVALGLIVMDGRIINLKRSI
jgi:drug/metabolite transporter (DMT)-like permease